MERQENDDRPSMTDNPSMPSMGVELFKTFIWFNLDISRNKRIKNFSYQNVLIKSFLDYCFENGIYIPANRKKVEDFFKNRDYENRDPILKFNSFNVNTFLQETDFNKKAFERTHGLQPYGYDVLKELFRIFLYHLEKNLSSTDLSPEVDEIFNFIDKKYNDSSHIRKTFLSKKYQDTLIEQINSSSSSNESFIWMFNFVTKYFPVYWAAKHIIGNEEETALMNTLKGVTRKIHDSLTLTGEIIGITKMESEGNFSYRVETFCDGEIFMFYVTPFLKNRGDINEKKNKKIYPNDILELGYIGASIKYQGRVKKIIEKHWTWKMPVYTLNYVKIISLPEK